MPIREDKYQPPENPRKQYAEEIFDRLPEAEIGVDIPRVHSRLLKGGSDTKLKLSAAERMSREGWNPQLVAGTQKGDLISNSISGEVFEVGDISKARKKVRNPENGNEGLIVAEPIRIAAQEYVYELSDNSRHSKKIKVYDTVYKNRSLATQEFFDSLVKSIPAGCMEVFDEIAIHKLTSGTGGLFRTEGSLFSDKGIIHLYVNENLFFKEGEYPIRGATEILYHELWHAVVKYLKGSINPGEQWRSTMRSSGKLVSQYAEKKRYPQQNDRDGEVEDIADSGKMYFATDGANTDKTRQLREFVAPRFEKLDGVMGQLKKRQNMNRVMRALKKPKTLY